MAAMSELAHNPKAALIVGYDPAIDVLYVTLYEAPCDAEGLPGGLELDYSALDGTPCGITVFGYNRNGWSESLRGLADIGGRHLGIDPLIVAKHIQAAVEAGKCIASR
jgi:uncharacterized protein YuzE